MHWHGSHLESLISPPKSEGANSSLVSKRQLLDWIKVPAFNRLSINSNNVVVGHHSSLQPMQRNVKTCASIQQYMDEKLPCICLQCAETLILSTHAQNTLCANTRMSALWTSCCAFYAMETAKPSVITHGEKKGACVQKFLDWFVHLQKNNWKKKNIHMHACIWNTLYMHLYTQQFLLGDQHLLHLLFHATALV